MAQINFNAQNVEPHSGGNFGPLPAGRYICTVIDSQWKATKAGTGRYLELTLEVAQGEFAKRLLWHRLNLDNPSEQAEEIAEAELSAICHAVGVLNLTDTQQLHGRPVDVTVTQRQADSGKVFNDCRGFAAVGRRDMQRQTQTQQPRNRPATPPPPPPPPPPPGNRPAPPPFPEGADTAADNTDDIPF